MEKMQGICELLIQLMHREVITPNERRRDEDERVQCKICMQYIHIHILVYNIFLSFSFPHPPAPSTRSDYEVRRSDSVAPIAQLCSTVLHTTTTL